MRYSFIITALSLLSSALAITVTAPSSDSVWDFSTAKTIKFTSGSSDPSVISIILRSKDGSFQTKLADNVKTSEGEYTTQPNPSISNGDDYEIQIIDSGGQLAVSDTFTVKKGASDDGTTSLSSSTSSSTSSTSSSTSSTSTSTSSSSTSTTTSSSSTTTTTTSSSATTTFTSVTPTLTSLVSSTSTSSTDPSASASAVPSTDAASSQLSGPKGAMAVLGAAFALIYV
ncbi:Cell wall beta-glucan synthesis [Penicillium roqueforti FM164]|uniref:Cell wall beta-glucan synthesis n=1 Tax=Penicillium roqueforti (strain FM164) TaxID=1365484 RepID=W6QNN9_PENRF|nr:Cell wall beta-glucan synthesis [Penicillium roqueforti FM164]